MDVAHGERSHLLKTDETEERLVCDSDFSNELYKQEDYKERKRSDVAQDQAQKSYIVDNNLWPEMLNQYQEGRVIELFWFGCLRFAQNMDTNTFVCIKEYRSKQWRDGREMNSNQIYNKSIQEIKIHKKLSNGENSCSYILKLLDVQSDELCVYLIFEYAPQGNLKAYVYHRNRKVTYEFEKLNETSRGWVTRPKCLDDWWKDARRLMTQLLYALECLHALNICHQDLSLENVFLDKPLNVKLTGLGSATDCEGEMMLDIPAGGKLRYISPEYFRENQKLDGKANDMWGYGVILFESLFSAIPWNLPDPDVHKHVRIVYGKTGGTKRLLEKHYLLWRSPKRVLDMFDKIFCSQDNRMTVKDALRHLYITNKEDEDFEPCFEVNDPVHSDRSPEKDEQLREKLVRSPRARQD